MSVIKLSGFTLLFLGMVAASTMLGGIDAMPVLQEMVKDMRWLLAVAGVTAGTLLLLCAENKRVHCRKA